GRCRHHLYNNGCDVSSRCHVRGHGGALGTRGSGCEEEGDSLDETSEAETCCVSQSKQKKHWKKIKAATGTRDNLYHISFGTVLLPNCMYSSDNFQKGYRIPFNSIHCKKDLSPILLSTILHNFSSGALQGFNLTRKQ
ncbi:hypothetical protein JRQ81_014718, partial [Phrynocephalus forsythii]